MEGVQGDISYWGGISYWGDFLFQGDISFLGDISLWGDISPPWQGGGEAALPWGLSISQPHCSQLLLVPEQIGAASTKLWPSCCAMTPTQHSAQPRGVMSISLQGKTPSEGVVSLLTPHRAQPAPCTFSGSLCSTMSGSGQDLGRCTQNVLLQQVAAETLPHMSASAENSRAG